MKAKLTAAFCANATCIPGRKRTDYWDEGGIPGLVLECRESGGKTWYLRYVQDGRQVAYKLGAYGDITFDQARKLAKRLRADVVLGGDPLAAKRERKAVPTYGELAQQHLAFAENLKSYSSIEAIMRVHILPRWKNVRISDIKPQDVASWLQTKDRAGLRPASVQKILVTFHRSFELAQRWGLPGSDRPNPAKGIPRAKFSNARQRFLTAEEAQRLRWAVELSSNKQLKHIVGLLLLTGMRVGELLPAVWTSVDLDRRSWRIPQSKNGKSRNVPLSQAAIDILNQVPRLKDCPYVLPNLETKQPFVSIKKAWQTARKLADLEDVRIHDLRHSAASFMVNAGAPLYSVAAVLGHGSSGGYAVTQRYAHLQNSSLLEAVEAGASKLSLNWAEEVQ